MKRSDLLVSASLVFISIFFGSCSNKPDKVIDEKSVPISKSENSGSFNESFSKLLFAYYTLKDAFIAGNPGKVNKAAGDLKKYSESFNVNEIKGDTSGTIKETAKYFTSTISGSAGTIIEKQDIEEKRREFEMLTDALWSLTRTVQYDGQKVYYLNCPKAFDDKGAYWLSDTIDLKNPYFGDNVANCADVADSLDYSKR